MTFINKFMEDVDERIIGDSVICLTSPHKAGDIINNRIILTRELWYGENIPTDEELDSIIFPTGEVVIAIPIDAIDDIQTDTDMTKYGFVRISDNRFCKTKQAIFWAKLEMRCRQ